MTSIKEYRAQFWVSDGQYNSVIEKSGLSSSEFMMLYCVSNGINTQSAICKKLYMPKQTINSAVKKFEKQGVISLACTKGNDKIKTLVLTDKGMELVRAKVLPMDDIEEMLWDELSETERAELVRLTTKYNKLFKEKQTEYFDKHNKGERI